MFGSTIVKRVTLLVVLFFVGIVSIFSQISITNTMVHRETTLPGQIYYGSISIRNYGIQNERVRLYQNDYLFFANGTNIYGEPGSILRSNAPWIQLVQEEVTIAPGKEAEVRFTVQVPVQEDLTGTYWSLVMVQSITDSLLNPDQEEGTVGITTGIRFGVQIVTNIGETGEPDLLFSNPSMNQQESTYLLQVDTENTGERYISFIPYVDLYSDRGLYIGRFESRRRGLYPGTSVRIQIPFPDVLPGKYRAQVIADGGDNDLFGVIYALEFK
jgi:hypothetical protein